MINGKNRYFPNFTPVILLFFVVGSAWAQQARFIHVAPFSEAESGTAVEFFIDGQLAVSGLSYGDYTNFGQMPIGDLEVSVRRSNDDSLLVSESIALDSPGSHWIYLIGDGDTRSFELIHLNSMLPLIGGGDVPTYLLNAAVVDGLGPLLLTKADGSSAGASPGGLSPVGFGEVQYVLRRSGHRNYKFTTPDGLINRIDLAPMHLSPPPNLTDIWQLVIIGDGHQYPLNVLSVPGGLIDLIDPVDHSSLGWWDTPNTIAAEGLMIQSLPSQNRVVGTIHTYADDDSGGQAWYTFDGAISHRSAMTEVFASTGGRLGGDEPTTLESVGTLAIDFDDCHSGSAELSLDTGAEVQWDLSRLTAVVDCGWVEE